MLPLLVALAVAGEVPTLDAVRARYPEMPGLTVAGADLTLYDPQGQPLSTIDGLVLVGLPDRAEAFADRQTKRRRAAVGLWVGGGAMALAASRMADQRGEDDLRAQATLAAGVATVGGGFAVRFLDPRDELGAWATEPEVRAGLAALVPPEGASPELAAQAAQVGAQRLRVDEDGVLRDAEGRELSMRALANRLELGEVEAEYRHRRAVDRVVWFSTIGVGGGVALGSSFVFLFSTIFVATGDPDIERIWLRSGAGILGGVATAGIGTTGLLVSRARHEDPSFWLDPAELKGAVEANEAVIQGTRGMPEPTGRIQVQPVIGPGTIGVAGTF